MKKTILLASVALTLLFSACGNSSSENTQLNAADTMHQHESDEVSYQCPMHPEVTSDKPGTCSVCEMDLEMVKGISKN